MARDDIFEVVKASPPDPSAFTVVDLFAGAGGLSLGFTWAGFRVVAAIELDDWAAATYEANHPAVLVRNGDISTMPDADLIAASGPQPDVLVGGPPCQGFSHSNVRNKDPRDPRNSLFREFLRAVDVLRPHACLLENVPGLLTTRDAHRRLAIDTILRAFSELGYDADFRLLNAVEQGVPQQRQRLFIAAFRDTTANGFQWPAAKHRRSASDAGPGFFDDAIGLSPPITLWDAISDLPPLQSSDEVCAYVSAPTNNYQKLMRSKEIQPIRNHEPMRHTARLRERFATIGYGESEAAAEGEHRPRRRGDPALVGRVYAQNSRRQRPDLPCNTVVASSHTNFLHPFLHRNFTVRELARVQSFPDWYEFHGKRAVLSRKLSERKSLFEDLHLDQRSQVGNAVPPLLALSLANSLANQLEAIVSLKRNSVA